MRDINDQVGAYRGLVESLAHKFVGRNSAEYDDLVQEGLIDVWQALGRGLVPSASVINNRMLDWVRFLGAQMGHGRGGDYATLLPMDSFVETDEDGEALALGDVLLPTDPVPLPGHDPLA